MLNGVTAIPDEIWIAGDKSKFVGAVVVKDWFNNTKKVYKFLPDGQIEKVGKKGSGKNQNTVSAVEYCFQVKRRYCFPTNNSSAKSNDKDGSVMDIIVPSRPVSRTCTYFSTVECVMVGEGSEGNYDPGETDGGGGGPIPGDYPPIGCDPGIPTVSGKSTPRLKQLPPCDEYNPIVLPSDDPYFFTATDYEIIQEIILEDMAADNIASTLAPCQGTQRAGNIQFHGTLEHWLIQFDYLTRVPGGVREYHVPGASSTGNGWPGYADIVNINTGEMYEIKSTSIQSMNAGSAEIAAYVAAAQLNCPPPSSQSWHAGTAYTTRFIYHPLVKNVVVKAELAASGLITYSNVLLQDSPLPAPVYLPESFRNKLNNLIRQLVNDPTNLEARILAFLRQNPQVVTYLKVGAAALIIATIVEDVLSGGVGVVDDPACFLIARTMWRIAAKM